MIPYGRQAIDDDDVAAVVGVLKGDWLTTGPHVEEFEQLLVEKTGARYAVAFASGTAALHGATAAGGLRPGDLVVTSPLSFVASANCARYVGATPGFVDIDPDTLNLAPENVPAEAAGLVAVHYGGLPVDLARLPHRPRVVIEDAAHALGATTPDGPVGSCARSDMCTFSFHPVKAITTGEGGAVTTNDRALAERLRTFRSHGTERPPGGDGWFYEVTSLGFNYRLTDIQAALGTSQLGKLERFVQRRAALADRYGELLSGSDVRLPPQPPAGFTSGWHLYPVRVADRRRVYEALRAAGIGAQVHYVPIHLHPVYADLGFRMGQFPHAEAAYEGLLSLPLFPDLTEDDQQRVVAALRAAL